MSIIELPWRARVGIALLCIGIGVASSTVAGRMLVHGLEVTEPDTTSRAILTAAGVLMIVTELTAFFLAALLPATRLYQLRILGLSLLVFEIVTIGGTRLVLNSSAEAATVAHATRIENVKRAIEARQADVRSLREVGERQTASEHAWARHLGVQTIQKAEALDREIEPLRETLADLQARSRPTLQHALGAELALAHSIAMPVLVSSTGLVLFGVAGLVLRRSAPVHKPEAPVIPKVSGLPHWKPIVASIPVAAVAAPAATAPVPVSVPQPATDTHATETADTDSKDDARYQQLRAAVLAGDVKPSMRAVRNAGYGGTVTVQRYLHRLVAEGVTAKSGQGYVVNQQAATHAKDPHAGRPST